MQRLGLHWTRFISNRRTMGARKRNSAERTLGSDRYGPGSYVHQWTCMYVCLVLRLPLPCAPFRPACFWPPLHPCGLVPLEKRPTRYKLGCITSDRLTSHIQRTLERSLSCYKLKGKKKARTRKANWLQSYSFLSYSQQKLHQWMKSTTCGISAYYSSATYLFSEGILICRIRRRACASIVWTGHTAGPHSHGVLDVLDQQEAARRCS
jgi:hypothetical protein